MEWKIFISQDAAPGSSLVPSCSDAINVDTAATITASGQINRAATIDTTTSATTTVRIPTQNTGQTPASNVATIVTAMTTNRAIILDQKNKIQQIQPNLGDFSTIISSMNAFISTLLE